MDRSVLLAGLMLGVMLSSESVAEGIPEADKLPPIPGLDCYNLLTSTRPERFQTCMNEVFDKGLGIYSCRTTAIATIQHNPRITTPGVGKPYIGSIDVTSGDDFTAIITKNTTANPNCRATTPIAACQRYVVHIESNAVVLSEGYSNNTFAFYNGADVFFLDHNLNYYSHFKGRASQYIMQGQCTKR